MVNIKAVNSQDHKDLKVRKNQNFIQSKNSHFVPIVVQEFVDVSKEFPIVFVKDSETGAFNSVALLGLEPNENLLFDEGGWLANYIPQLLSFYPFLLQQVKQEEQALLCIDEDSELINKDFGERMFDESGNQKAWLTDKAESIVKHLEGRQVTQNFIKLLINNELLVMQTLSIKLSENSEYDLNGLYVVDEEKFNNLPDDELLQLRAAGALPAIYATLMSMRCINQLVKRKITQ